MLEGHGSGDLSAWCTISSVSTALEFIVLLWKAFLTFFGGTITVDIDELFAQTSRPISFSIASDNGFDQMAPESILSHQAPNNFLNSIGINPLKSRTIPRRGILDRLLLIQSTKSFRKGDRRVNQHHNTATNSVNAFAFGLRELGHRKRAGDQDPEAQFRVAPKRQPSGVVGLVRAGAAHGHVREVVYYHDVGDACSVRWFFVSTIDVLKWEYRCLICQYLQ